MEESLGVKQEESKKRLLDVLRGGSRKSLDCEADIAILIGVARCIVDECYELDDMGRETVSLIVCISIVHKLTLLSHQKLCRYELLDPHLPN